MKNKIVAVVSIGPNGFNIVAIKPETEIVMPTVEEQALDSSLGLMADSSSSTTFVKAINQLFRLGTGRDKDIVELIPDVVAQEEEKRKPQ